jgi:hypothetical protein
MQNRVSSRPEVPAAGHDEDQELVAAAARARLRVDVAKQNVRLAKEELKRARKRYKEAKREAKRARRRAAAARKALKRSRRKSGRALEGPAAAHRHRRGKATNRKVRDKRAPAAHRSRR